jgi:regulatory protein
VPIGKAPKRVDRNALQHYAAMLLAQRAMSTGEMRQKLQLRALSPEDVDAVLEQLKEYGALDDAKYAAAYASVRKENQGFGQARVLRDLNRKRIPSELAKQAVSTTFEGADETAMIEDYLARKFRGKNLPEYLADQKHLASAFRRLRTAGFSSGTTLKVLRRYSEQAGQIDENDLD